MVVDCTCSWLAGMSTVVKYIVWLLSQLKHHPSEPDPGERSIWVLKDYTCSGNLFTTCNGKLMYLFGFMSSSVSSLVIYHIAFNVVHTGTPPPIVNVCAMFVCVYCGVPPVSIICCLHCWLVLVSFQWLLFPPSKCWWRVALQGHWVFSGSCVISRVFLCSSASS